MKVGDYVRTNKGIGKIISQNDSVRFAYPCAWETDTYLEINDDTEYVYDEDIIKSSPNIIDLIEVGDYVNGMKITNKYIDNETGNIELEFNNGSSYLYPKSWNYEARSKKYKIKSIVTKEQFSQMEYRIGE